MYNKMYNKIINPKNGKKVSINSKLGRKIIKKYMKFVGGASATDLAAIRETVINYRQNQEQEKIYRAKRKAKQMPRRDIVGSKGAIGQKQASKTPTKSLNIVVSDSSPNGSRFAQHVFQNVHKDDFKSTFERFQMTLNLPGESYKLDIQHLPALNTLLGRITEETNIIILPLVTLVNRLDIRSEYEKLTKLINEANSVAPNALIIIATDRTNNHTSVTRAISSALEHRHQNIVRRTIVNRHDELISKRQLVFLDYDLDLDGREMGRILDSYNAMSSRVEFAKAQYGPISKLLGVASSVASSAASSAASYAKNMWSWHR